MLGCQVRQDGCRVALGIDEVTPCRATRATVERVKHERDPGRAGVVENGRVENEYRDDRVRWGRRGEASVVRCPEITAMPVQAHT